MVVPSLLAVAARSWSGLFFGPFTVIALLAGALAPDGTGSAACPARCPARSAGRLHRRPAARHSGAGVRHSAAAYDHPPSACRHQARGVGARPGALSVHATTATVPGARSATAPVPVAPAALRNAGLGCDHRFYPRDSRWIVGGHDTELLTGRFVPQQFPAARQAWFPAAILDPWRCRLLGMRPFFCGGRAKRARAPCSGTATPTRSGSIY